MVDALPFGGKKKGADGGIDGIIYFKPRREADREGAGVGEGRRQRSVNMIRDLHSAMEREKAPIGVFITAALPTRRWKRKRPRSAGSRTNGAGPIRGCKSSRLAELFQGKKPDIPFVDPASVKRAKREDTSAAGNLL